MKCNYQMILLQITKDLSRIIILVPALILGQMSGTKVIGSGGDYTTFVAAASALNSYGVDGPVTFNVLNGTYDGDFSLNSITGTSETNTITFQSYSGNAGDVIVTDSYYNAQYVVLFNGADYVTFKNMTFDRSTTGSNKTKLIEIRSGTDYITFDNCVFKGYNHNSGSTNYSLIYTYNADQYDGIVIKNCSFTNGGGYAIDLRNGATGGTGLEIINNSFTDTHGGIYAKYFDAVTIRGNTIKGAGLYDTGIRLDYCDGANVVEDNSIYGPDMTYGIYLNYCQATSGSEATIVNNLISVEDYGIYMYTYNIYQNVYYNSVQVRDSNALFYHSNNDQFDSKNNIFYSASSSSPARPCADTELRSEGTHEDCRNLLRRRSLRLRFRHQGTADASSFPLYPGHRRASARKISTASQESLLQRLAVT